MNTVLKRLGLGGAALLLGATGSLLWLRHADLKDAERLSHRLEAGPSESAEVFTEAMVAALPEPARRYLVHAIAPGTPLAQAVVLAMEGTMRINPDGPWLPMRAHQVLAPPYGFVWQAAVGQGALRFSGADAYADNEGWMRFRAWNLIPIVRASGADITRSARGRLAIEAVMQPAALLPQRGAVWEGLDAHTARVTLTIDGEAIPITLTIAPSGALRAATMDRWGNQTADGHYALIPFGVEVLEEQAFAGYTIPSRVQVGWRPGTARRIDFFRATIRHAAFR